MLSPKISALIVFLACCTAQAELVISEFVADSAGTILDSDGDASDWIEIHNPTAGTLSTAGLYLTDDPVQPTKWPLPSIDLLPLENLVIFASGKNRSDPAGELHTNFSLAAAGEYLALIDTDGVTAISEFSDAQRQFYGTAFGLGFSGSATETTTFVPRPTSARWWVPDADIGNAWQLSGFDDSTWTSTQTGIGFGEPDLADLIGAGGDTSTDMLNNNASVYLRIPFVIADPANITSMSLAAFFDDGFVAYINGHLAASANAPENLTHTSAATDSAEVSVGDPATEFSLDFAGHLIAGENILAVQVMNRSPIGSDFLFVPEVIGETRLNTGGNNTAQLGYLATPTPGFPNAALEFTDFVRDTTFDVDRGFFDAPFDVTIACPTPGATIIYTTNGDNPTLTNGTQVTAPSTTVTISTTTPLRAAAFKTGCRSTNTDTQTYFFLDDVVVQPAQPAGYPFPWVARDGGVIVGDYDMSPAVVDAIYSRAELKDALLDLPTISVVTDVANLFDQEIGIQVNSRDDGPDSERPVSVEFIGFDSSPALQLNAGMLMNGNASRNPNRPKHNFRLAFRNTYGAGRLEYPLFGEDAATDRFNQIVVRGGNGNSWTHPDPDTHNFAMFIRDQWFRDAFSAMGYPEVLQREAHVYLNGLYWGIHHIFERIEEEWTAERFGGNEEDWEGFRIVGGNNIEIIAGTPEEETARMLDSWQATLDAAQAGDLATVEQYLDLDHFIDYLLLNYHGGNSDWDQNNVRAMRRTNPPGKFQFFCHDTERAGFSSLNNSSIDIDITDKNTTDAPTSISTDLRTHPEFAIRFADRTYKHLFNNGALTPENGAAMWAARAETIRNPLKAESARWGDFRGLPPRTLVEWQIALDREYNDWFPHRTPFTISQLRGVGLYPAIDPPAFSQHGGAVTAGSQVAVSNLEGDIYVTTDGSDPRLPGGTINPTATRLDGAAITEIIAPGSTWRYLDDGTDQGTAWRQSNFDGSAWLTETAPLGYGNINGIGTIPNPINDGRFLTNYFRQTITLANTGLLTAASVEVMADAGAVVYINGQEVARDNMPAGTIDFNTPALSESSPESAFNPYSFDPAILNDGTNTIAVESHNWTPFSSDMFVDIRIETVGNSAQSAPINSTQTLKARSLTSDGTWSALAEAAFLTGTPAASGNFTITELLYNPAGPTEDGEFIELMNLSAGTIDLAGVSFTAGITYTFPADATLAPGARLVLTPADYTGNLDNGGETITLTAADGSLIQTFRYNDRAPWPTAPDGEGSSLTLIAPASTPDPNTPTNWRSSLTTGGTPGSTDATTFPGSTPAELLTYALGTANSPLQPSIAAIEINGNIEDYLIAEFPLNQAADDLLYEVQFSTDLKTWATATEGFLGTTETAGSLPKIRWRAPSPITALAPRHYARLRVSLRE